MSKMIAVIAGWAMMFGLTSLANAESTTPLTLNNAYLIDGLAHQLSGLEPSGIDVCNGTLAMVSDKHDDVIFS